MTFRKILILMGGFKNAVDQDLMSKGSADGIIQHLLEERGIYGSKGKDQIKGHTKAAIRVDYRSQRLGSANQIGSCSPRTQVHRELVLRRHARILREVSLPGMSQQTFTQTV